MATPSRTVLLVDDEPETLRLLINEIEKTGFATIVANSGTDALELATSHRPLVILSDLEMPGMHGYELLELLNQNPDTSRIPFLIYHTEWVWVRGTPPPLNQMFQRTLSGRFADFAWTKPLDPREVVTLIRRIYDSSPAT